MITVGELAALVGGSVMGDGSRPISDVADLSSAESHHLSFLTNRKYRDQLASTRAGAVLVHQCVVGVRPALIVCPNPYLALARISAFFHPTPTYAAGVEAGAHVHATATVDASATVRVGAIVEAQARVGARTVIGAGAHVGVNATIGADCLLHPGANVLDRCWLGDRVILHAGVVIGSDGFGYAPDEKGQRHKIPQIGIVVVEDDVEIGANTTVDRATFGETRIGARSKIDNLVQIAHNVVLGEDCVIVSQSGIAGSATLGRRVIMGAQGGVVGHVHVADDVMLGARAGVASSIEQAGVYSGAPTMDHRHWLKATVLQQFLPELRDQVRELRRRLDAMQAEK